MMHKNIILSCALFSVVNCTLNDMYKAFSFVASRSASPLHPVLLLVIYVTCHFVSLPVV